MNKDQKIEKKVSKGCLVIFLVAIAAGFIYFMTQVQKSDDHLTLKKSWNKMTYKEHQKWLKSYLESPDDAGYQLVYMMEKNVENKFNFPEEVEFDKSPTFINAIIVEADSGIVLVNGTGQAKNAFGVKSKFHYACRLRITDSLRVLENVSVNTF